MNSLTTGRRRSVLGELLLFWVFGTSDIGCVQTGCGSGSRS